MGWFRDRRPSIPISAPCREWIVKPFGKIFSTALDRCAPVLQWRDRSSRLAGRNELGGGDRDRSGASGGGCIAQCRYVPCWDARSRSPRSPAEPTPSRFREWPGIPTLAALGPGMLPLAHGPNEWVSLQQPARGDAHLRADRAGILRDSVSADGGGEGAWESNPPAPGSPPPAQF